MNPLVQIDSLIKMDPLTQIIINIHNTSLTTSLKILSRIKFFSNLLTDVKLDSDSNSIVLNFDEIKMYSVINKKSLELMFRLLELLDGKATNYSYILTSNIEYNDLDTMADLICLLDYISDMSESRSMIRIYKITPTLIRKLMEPDRLSFGLNQIFTEKERLELFFKWEKDNLISNFEESYFIFKKFGLKALLHDSELKLYPKCKIDLQTYRSNMMAISPEFNLIFDMFFIKSQSNTEICVLFNQRTYTDNEITFKRYVCKDCIKNPNSKKGRTLHCCDICMMITDNHIICGGTESNNILLSSLLILRDLDNNFCTYDLIRPDF